MTEKKADYRTGFDPAPHIRTVKYQNRKTGELTERKLLDTAPRIAWFRSDHPIDSGWCLTSEAIQVTDDYADFMAQVINPDGVAVSTGYRRVWRSDFGNYVEKAETQAKGRALEGAGYGCLYALTFEPDEGEGEADTANGAVKAHWIDDAYKRRYFWAKVGELGLDEPSLKKLVNIDQVHDWKGSANDLLKAAKGALSRQQEIAELCGEEA